MTWGLNELHNSAVNFYEKYEPTEILGTGASSTVRLCIEKSTGLEWAVKIIDINSGVYAAEEIKYDVAKEVEIHMQLSDHPNIIKFHEIYQTDAYIFLVLERCSKGELFDFLNTANNLSEKRTRFFMKQILQALKYIHSKRIVHRDMKPENVLLDSDLNAKLADFGLACYLSDEDELCSLRGTPIYLAPEVLRVGYYEDANPYDYAVDLWACGVILYTCLIGRPPFWHRKEHLMLRSIMEGKYQTDIPEWEEMSDEAKSLINQLLEVNPDKRLTATQALQHSFFVSQSLIDVGSIAAQEITTLTFNAKRIFRSTVIAMQFISRLHRIHSKPPSIFGEILTTDPYSNKRMRKFTDQVAFFVYKHWIKKVDDQNKATLYELCPRRDLVEAHQAS